MASGVTISLKGVQNLQKHFEKMANPAKVRTAVTQGTAMVLASAKSIAPTSKYGGGGALRGSIHMNVESRETEIVGKVFAGGGHAMYVEFGTGVVGQDSKYPRVAELGLKYAQYPWTYTPDGGEHFYRTRGYRARPFMYPALKRNKTKIIQLIRQAIREDLR